MIEPLQATPASAPADDDQATISPVKSPVVAASSPLPIVTTARPA